MGVIVGLFTYFIHQIPIIPPSWDCSECEGFSHAGCHSLDRELLKPLPPAVPRVVRVDRPAGDVIADRKAASFLSLNDLVVAFLADGLMVVRVDEQCPIAFVSLAMVDRCCPNDLSLAQVTLASRFFVELTLP